MIWIGSPAITESESSGSAFLGGFAAGGGGGDASPELKLKATSQQQFDLGVSATVRVSCRLLLLST